MNTLERLDAAIAETQAAIRAARIVTRRAMRAGQYDVMRRGVLHVRALSMRLNELEDQRLSALRAELACSTPGTN